MGFLNVYDREEYKISKYLPHLGSYKDIKEIVREHQVEEVIIAIERSETDTIDKIIASLEETSVMIKIIPIMQDILLGSVKLSGIWHAPLIEISPDLMPAWQQSLKRLMDILVSIIAIILLIPVYILTAIGVKMSSSGPVFYSQERIGLRGKPFKMYKFRSMYIDAEERKKELEKQNEMNGLMFKMENDPRVTKVGKFLRKTSLDEFPQFFNIFKGDMSMVGTRPPTEEEFSHYNMYYRRRMSMTPGLTGMWQVNGRSEVEDFDDVVKYDLEYIDNWSLSLDCKILWKTISVVFRHKGAE